MSDDDYLRLIAGQLHSLLLLQVAREMFDKSFAALGTGELAAVYAMVGRLETENSQFLSPVQITQIVTSQQEAQKQRPLPGFAPTPDKKDS